MQPDSTSQDRSTIRELLSAIHHAWTTGQTDDLAPLFHERMVLLPPGMHQAIQGRDACVRSYSDFLRAARVVEYTQGDPCVQVWGDTAVGSFGWEMAWEMGGQAFRESGHDVWVFARADGRWQAVWRTLIPAPAPTV